MTEFQKEQVKKLRLCGLGYIKVAQAVGISENTVKSYCRRNNLAGDIITFEGALACKFCGNILGKKKGKKVFCNNSCRQEYWKNNQSKINRKTATEHVCLMCKNTFIDYAKKNRKYCSRNCYIAARYQEVDVRE